MGAACGKNKAKEPKRAGPTELEEKAKREAEAKAAQEAAAREAAAAQAKAEAEAASAAAAAAKEAEAKKAAEAAAAAAAAAPEEEEEEQTKCASEEQARPAEQFEQPKVLEGEDGGEQQKDQEACKETLADSDETARDDESKHLETLPSKDQGETVMESAQPVRKVSEKQHGSSPEEMKRRTVTPCDMTTVDETSKYVSKRCGCDIGNDHDENSCQICQSIDLSDAPLLN